MYRVLYIALLLLYSSVSLSQGLAEIAQRDSFAGDIFGDCQTPRGMKIESKHRRSFRYYKKSSFDYPVDLVGNFHWDRRQRDVTFIIPGTFEDAEGPYGIRSPYIDYFAALSFKAGNHVVQLPGPLGTGYLGARPKHTPGHLLGTATNYFAMMRITLKKMQEMNISVGEIKLMGVSLGAFYSAVVADLDAQKNSIISDIVLLAPPYNLRESMEVLDQKIDEIRANVKSMPVLRTPLLSFKGCFAGDDAGFSEDDLQKLQQGVLYYAFIGPLMRVVKTLKKQYPEALKEYHPSLSQFRERADLFSLTSFMNVLSPEVSEAIDGPEGDLFYWLEKNHVKAHIITTENDFIVRGVPWPNHHQHLDITRLKRGGHLGFRGSANFTSFFKHLHRPLILP